jgi:Spy/CpxP family protein refolding chaperone
MKASKRTTALIVLLAVFVLAGISAAVQAAPRRGDGPHDRPGHFMHIIDFLLDLDLTPEQKDDLQAVFTDTRDTLKPLLEDMHELRSAMDETFLGEEIDAARASSQIEEMSRLKAQITTAGLTAMLQAAQVLTPEQRQTIMDTRNEWKSRFTRLRNMMLSLFGHGPVD